MLEIGIVFGLEVELAFQQQGRHPIGIAAIDLEGQVMEVAPLRLGLYRDDSDSLAHRLIPGKKRGTIASEAPI